MSDGQPVGIAFQSAEQAVRTTGLIALALVLGPLVFLIVAIVVPLGGTLHKAVLPIALVGLVTPVVAYRLYQWLRERIPVTAGAAQRSREFFKATVIALGVSEAVALLSIIVYWLSQEPIALVGMATHVIVAGSIWPSRERVERFLAGRTFSTDEGSP